MSSRREFHQDLSPKAKAFIEATKIKDLKNLKKELQITLRQDYGMSRDVLRELKLSTLIETYLFKAKRERIGGS